jgi:hypothetical protein
MLLKKIAMLVLFVIITGWIPAYAYIDDASDDDVRTKKIKTYRIADDVTLKPSVSVQYDKPRIVVKAVYPMITSVTLDDNIDSFNRLVSDIIHDAMVSFREKVLVNQSAQIDFPKEKIKNDLNIDFNTSVVNGNDSPIISIRFTIQGYITGTTHPFNLHRVLNYDLYNGAELQLAELFKPDSDYLTMISSYTRNILNRRLKDKSMVERGTAAVDDNFKNWNINPHGLLITFDEAQVAKPSLGTQTVLIPYSVLKLILAPDSFAMQCVKHRRRCIQNNVLTGGFIDEAAGSPKKFRKTVVAKL